MHHPSLPRLLARPIRRTVALGLLLLPWAAELPAQSTGRVSGHVLAADTRQPLPGARVEILGSGLVAVAGEGGLFTLTNIPSGRVSLRASFLGRSPRTIELTITSGATATTDLLLDAVNLSPVMVRASGQAEALSRQKNAANIKSVVASDQMGRFPDASAPEAVQRLPGVALQRDQGEGRYVQLRGASAATTQVTVNGEQIGSPEADSRQIALDAIPVGVLAAVEVSKAITPDMDAEAVGGSVNLVTKRAAPGRTLTVEAAGGYAPIREQGSGLSAVTFGQRTADNRLGMLLSGSFGERNFGSDNIEPSYDGEDLEELQVRYYSLWRRRTGLTGSFDFKPTPGTTFYLNGLWSELQDKEQRRILESVVPDGELAYYHKNRLEKIGTINVLAGAEHALPRGLSLDYRAGFTRSQEDTPFDREVAFLQEDVTFAPSRSDITRPQSNPQGNALAGPYLFDEFVSGSSLTRNRDVVGAANLTVPVRLRGERSLQFRFGVKLRDKRKDQVLDYRETGADDDIVLGSDLGSRFDNADFAAGPYPVPYSTTPADVLNFAQRFAGRLDSPEADLEAQSEAFVLRERVSAGYAMAEWNLSPKLLLLPGLRVEHTALESDGNAWDADEESLTPVSARNSFTNLFPMAHLRYRWNERVNVRAAYTTSIFRPNFIDLVPYRIVDGGDIETGNPDLQPTLARNYDLMIERYDDNIGLLSAGVFLKSLDRPIFTRTVDNGEGDTSQPVNVGAGEVRGVELAWQQRLTFLPGLLNGLGLYANFTLTESEATLPDGRRTRLAGQSERAYNVAVSYEKRGFSGQVSLNHVGGYIDEIGDEAADDLYARSRSQLDLSLSYFVSRSTQLYLEALNLTNAEYRTFQGSPDFIRQRELYRPSVQVGLRFRP